MLISAIKCLKTEKREIQLKLDEAIARRTNAMGSLHGREVQVKALQTDMDEIVRAIDILEKAAQGSV